MAVNYETHGKRFLDMALASVGLLVAVPIGLAVAGAIAVESGRPVLFIQERVGAGGAPFRLLKFRSMAVGAPNVESAEAGHLQVTKVGRIIRRLNLDELPQLLNVLKGDMSLVGPRPALPSQEDLLSARGSGGAERLKPGLTGLAQVHSYDGMTPEAKAAFDNRYAADVTLVGDLRVFARTVTYLFSPPPVY